MADELTPEMLQEAQPDLLTLEDEDGKECTFEAVSYTHLDVYKRQHRQPAEHGC